MSADLTAREYLRVSFDKSTRQRSNEEQHEDNLDFGELVGITEWGQPYLDLGSASKFKRHERDDFDRLRADLRSGKFRADVLVVWEISRLSREVSDWPGMLADCERAGVRIGVNVDARIYDPANPTDYNSLIHAAADAHYESAKVSLRTKRAMRRAAAKGALHGRIPFGYRRVLDSEGQLVQRPEPAEAKIVVELFKRLQAGEPLAAISRDFTARGIASRKGVPFVSQTLRGMALAPVYIGRRVHLPGKTGRAQRGTEAKTTRGCWDPLVSDELFYAVRRRLTDPARRTVLPGRGIHLLSMLARCDVCDAKLAVTYRKGPRAYQCSAKGCVRVNADALDDWATRRILWALAQPDAIDRLYKNDDQSEQLAAALGAVEQARSEHADLIALARSRKMSPALMAAMEDEIRDRQTAAEATVAELTTASGLHELITPGSNIAQEWQALGEQMHVKREIVRLVFSPKTKVGPLTVARVNGDDRVAARVRLNKRSVPSR